MPVIAYDAMWSLVGLHHYWPYQLLAVLAHLVVCALLLLVMRRAGVAPGKPPQAAASVAAPTSRGEAVTCTSRPPWPFLRSRSRRVLSHDDGVA